VAVPIQGTRAHLDPSKRISPYDHKGHKLERFQRVSIVLKVIGIVSFSAVVRVIHMYNYWIQVKSKNERMRKKF